MLRAFLTNRITWALTGLVVLAVLLPVGLRNSDAAFVAGSSNPGSIFSSASSFNTVVVSLTDPGSPLRGTVIAQRRRHLRPRHGHRRLPDLARRRQHLDDRLHRQRRAVQLQLGHDRRRRRPA